MIKSLLYSILLLLSLSIITSCDNKNKYQIETITTDKFTNDDLILKGSAVKSIREESPRALGIIDTTLLVIDQFDAPYFRFYRLTDLSFIGNYGQRGSEPNQLRSPNYNNQYFYKDGQLQFVISDSKNLKVSVLALNKIIKDSNAYPEIQYRIPSELILRYNTIFLTPDTSLIGDYNGPGTEGVGKFFRYDINEKVLDWIPYYNTVDADIPDKAIPYFYYSFCAYNQKRNTLGAAMHQFKKVDFVNLSDNRIKQVVFVDDQSPIPELNGDELSPSNIQQYIESFASDRYFYGIHTNTTYQKYSKNEGNLELHVFNWNGEKVKSVRLDRIFLGRFVVDEHNEKLYIINFGVDKKSAPILQYDLANLNLFNDEI